MIQKRQRRVMYQAPTARHVIAQTNGLGYWIINDFKAPMARNKSRTADVIHVLSRAFSARVN
jgi:hypothetical protein